MIYCNELYVELSLVRIESNSTLIKMCSILFLLIIFIKKNSTTILESTSTSERLRFMKTFWTWTKKSDLLRRKNSLILNFGIHDFPYNSIRKSFRNIHRKYICYVKYTYMFLF